MRNTWKTRQMTIFKPTEIKLYKFNMEIKTTNIFLANRLRKLGWKIKYSNLGELL